MTTETASTVLNLEPTSPLLAHIPHSSIAIPPHLRDQIILDDAELNNEIRLLTDWFTLDLYAPIIDAGGSAVVFNLSRFIVDPERFEDDSQEVMAQRGMGVIYQKTTQNGTLRRTITQHERGELIGYYRSHHRLLTTMTEKILGRFGYCILIDCHSYPEQALPYEINTHAQRPEICIGTDPYHTPSLITEIVQAHAEGAGYSVGINAPFAGALVPMQFYQQEPAIVSVMLEVNRGTYMNELTSVTHEGFSKVQRLIKDISASFKQIDSSQFMKRFNPNSDRAYQSDLEIS